MHWERRRYRHSSLKQHSCLLVLVRAPARQTADHSQPTRFADYVCLAGSTPSALDLPLIMHIMRSLILGLSHGHNVCTALWLGLTDSSTGPALGLIQTPFSVPSEYRHKKRLCMITRHCQDKITWVNTDNAMLPGIDAV